MGKDDQLVKARINKARKFFAQAETTPTQREKEYWCERVCNLLVPILGQDSLVDDLFSKAKYLLNSPIANDSEASPQNEHNAQCEEDFNEAGKKLTEGWSHYQRKNYRQAITLTARAIEIFDLFREEKKPTFWDEINLAQA